MKGDSVLTFIKSYIIDTIRTIPFDRHPHKKLQVFYYREVLIWSFHDNSNYLKISWKFLFTYFVSWFPFWHRQLSTEFLLNSLNPHHTWKDICVPFNVLSMERNFCGNRYSVFPLFLFPYMIWISILRH